MNAHGVLTGWGLPFRRPPRPAAPGPQVGPGGGRRPGGAVSGATPDSRPDRERRRSPGQVFMRLGGLVQMLLLAFLLAFTAYQSHHIFFKADYFRIQDVEVRGHRALSPVAIEALSGIVRRDLFFEYDYQSVRQRLLTHPRIGQASVTVASPNRIRIEVVERRPVMRVVDGTHKVEIDESGRVLGDAMGTADLPTVTGVRVLASGVGVTLDPAQADQVAACWRALSGGALRAFSGLEVVSPFKVIVHWKGLRVLVADPVQLERNAVLTDRILEEARDRGRTVEVLDMRLANVLVRFSHPVPSPSPARSPSPVVPPDPARGPAPGTVAARHGGERADGPAAPQAPGPTAASATAGPSPDDVEASREPAGVPPASPAASRASAASPTPAVDEEEEEEEEEEPE